MILIDVACTSFLFLSPCQKLPKKILLPLSPPSSIKRKWSMYFNNSSTGKLICCTTYLWMFYCIDKFSYVLLFLIISALVLALQQKKGKAQYNFWKHPKISMFHLSLLVLNLKKNSIAFTTVAVCLSFFHLIYIYDISNIIMSFLTLRLGEKNRE